MFPLSQRNEIIKLWCIVWCQLAIDKFALCITSKLVQITCTGHPSCAWGTIEPDGNICFEQLPTSPILIYPFTSPYQLHLQRLLAILTTRNKLIDAGARLFSQSICGINRFLPDPAPFLPHQLTGIAVAPVINRMGSDDHPGGITSSNRYQSSQTPIITQCLASLVVSTPAPQSYYRQKPIA